MPAATYVIVSRVLSSSGQPLAVQYNPPKDVPSPLTLAIYDPLKVPGNQKIRVNAKGTTFSPIGITDKAAAPDKAFKLVVGGDTKPPVLDIWVAHKEVPAEPKGTVYIQLNDKAQKGVWGATNDPSVDTQIIYGEYKKEVWQSWSLIQVPG
ncbi:hypothetical protein BS47DRAFT_1348557 [Hydnum rufescens UP504]|uniref:Uncharacterized protein n=1 Tax=Hydnum rufescens UP504 TaxID=1448309 RepID=A0A9P6AQW1_9AGAM|nr:hypothetical protein BS47DRAFT_1348557 [Hydnum rufescens UP504]